MRRHGRLVQGHPHYPREQLAVVEGICRKADSNKSFFFPLSQFWQFHSSLCSLASSPRDAPDDHVRQVLALRVDATDDQAPLGSLVGTEDDRNCARARSGKKKKKLTGLLNL